MHDAVERELAALEIDGDDVLGPASFKHQSSDWILRSPAGWRA